MSSTERLAAAIDDIHGLDLAELTDPEREAHALALTHLVSRLQAEQARAVAAVAKSRSWAADGSRSCAAWLARETYGCRSTAAAAIRFGEALEQMPAVAVAVYAGEITVQHARLLASCRRFKPEEFAEAEETLLGHARKLTFPQFVRVCAHWREVVDPDGSEDRAAKQFGRRHLLFGRRPDGTVDIQSGELDAVGGEAFLTELQRIERELLFAEWAEAKARLGRVPLASDLARSSAQRWADALVEMAHRSATAPRDGKRPLPLISVYVDYQTVTGRLCELASGVPVTPGQVLPLLGEAEVERIVFGPANRVIELGVRDRFFTGGLRRAIQLRDRYCRYPGCTEPVQRCEVDHDIDYAKGGETTQENGKLLCGTHNRNKHKHRRWWIDPTDPHDVTGDDEDDDPPLTEEEIDRLTRRCRARLRALSARRPGWERTREADTTATAHARDA